MLDETQFAASFAVHEKGAFEASMNFDLRTGFFRQIEPSSGGRNAGADLATGTGGNLSTFAAS
jgi:hypothetical protein